jgi:hypothetical protein
MVVASSKTGATEVPNQEQIENAVDTVTYRDTFPY